MKRGLGATVPVFSLGLMVSMGCGSPGAPQPPSLKLPTPPTDLSLTRAGDEVRLRWTMPRRATDRVLLAGDQRVVICRALAPEPCHSVGEVLLQAAGPATYTDTLPPALAIGAARLLTYSVLLQNSRRQGAGPSNPAFTAAGAAPPQVTTLRAETRAPGEIVLHWQPLPDALQRSANADAHADLQANFQPATHSDAQADSPSGGSSSLAPERLVLLHRTRQLPAGAPPRPRTATPAGVPPPDVQVLAIHLPPALPPARSETMAQGWTLDHAADRDAALNRTYTYSVERVARLVLAGHSVEVTSAASAPVTVVAQDTFAPAPPAGLEAVADAEGGAIDLSWTPDPEADVAGYFVYRRIARAEALPVRVSGPRPLVNTTWRDAAAQAGILYAYSVSATDTSGNESPRSSETQESVVPVPRQPK